MFFPLTDLGGIWIHSSCFVVSAHSSLTSDVFSSMYRGVNVQILVSPELERRIFTPAYNKSIMIICYMMGPARTKDQQGSQIHQQNVSISVLLRASSRQIINFPRQIYEPYTWYLDLNIAKYEIDGIYEIYSQIW